VEKSAKIWLDNKDNSSDIGKWIHYAFGLLFLSPEKVGDCYVEDLMTDCPENEQLQKYCESVTIQLITIYPMKVYSYQRFGQLTRQN